jgi:pilus assembly protein TadC
MSKRLPVISGMTDALLPYMPGQNRRLGMAGYKKTPEDFLDGILTSAFLMSILITAITAWVCVMYWITLAVPVLAFIVVFVSFFYHGYIMPDLRIIQRKKEIDNEIVFAAKHLIVEISSGIPLFEAMVGTTHGYGAVSDEFKKIVERVTFGEPLTHVLRDTAEKTPSPSFRRILIQVANSVISGANVARSLESTTDQISKEQILEVKEYGQKLNPLIMFYLVIAVIFPSLGMIFVMILLSFVGKGVTIPLVYMILAALVLGFVQYMFLAFVKSSRPKYAFLG